MERINEIWSASLLGRWLTAVCAWFSRQWAASGVVRWFVHPKGWSRALSESSVFFRLWTLLRRGLCWLYEKLRLEKLFAGSMFTQAALWCALPVALAPLLPTMAVVALCAVGYASLLLCLIRDRERRLAWSPLNRWVLLYAAVYAAVIFTSVTPRGSLSHGLLMVFFIGFALVVENTVDTWRKAEDLVLLMVAVGGVVSLLGIGQYLLGVTGAAAWLDKDMFGEATRVYSTLQNPNVLAEYLILMIPFGGAVLLSSRSHVRRLAALVCCGLMCVCMILTLSRGGWLGLLAAGAIFFILLNPRLMVLIPFALAALYFLMPASVVARFASIGDLKDGSTSYRVSIWMGTIAMLKDGYWLCGVGPGTNAFNLIYPAYSYNTANAQHSHNLFLQILCDGGICALAAFGSVIVSFCRCVCSALSRAKSFRDRCFLIASISAVGGFMVQSMTDYTFYNYRVTLLFWAVLGLGAAFAGLAGKEAAEP